jgi:transcription elongation factor GreA
MAGESETEAITAEGLEALKAELHQLETVGRREMSAIIQAAREEGDLKENTEYHQAKETQGLMETKILRLQERLRRAQVVEPDASSDVVVFGSKVSIVDETSGKAQTWTIVGPTEASVPDGRLSSESPIAQALMGARAGDTVSVQTPKGARPIRVEKLGG